MKNSFSNIAYFHFTVHMKKNKFNYYLKILFQQNFVTKSQYRRLKDDSITQKTYAPKFVTTYAQTFSKIHITWSLNLESRSKKSLNSHFIHTRNRKTRLRILPLNTSSEKINLFTTALRIKQATASVFHRDILLFLRTHYADLGNAERQSSMD